MRSGIYSICPFHPDHSPSLFIDEEMDAHCFACGWDGTIADVMRAMGYSGRDILFKQDEFLKTAGWYERSVKGDGAIVRPTQGWEEASVSLRLDITLVRERWEFLLSRGYLMETLIAFRTHSWKGVIFGWPADGEKWVTRWRMGDKKYLYDTGFSRASLYHPDPNAFGYTFAIVVEGVLDSMKVWQAGYRNVFATLGGPTVSQMRQLRGFEAVYEMFDNDDGGDAHRRMLERDGVQAKRVQYDGGDPGDLSDQLIQSALRREVAR